MGTSAVVFLYSFALMLVPNLPWLRMASVIAAISSATVLLTYGIWSYILERRRQNLRRALSNRSD